jgi:hypothetical protein
MPCSALWQLRVPGSARPLAAGIKPVWRAPGKGRGLRHRIGIIRCSYGVPGHITYGFDVLGSASFG